MQIWAREMKNNRIVHILFNISMILKWIDGFFELLGGLAFVILKKEHILRLISHILNYNLFNIPNETISRWVTEISNALTTNIKIFISIILICNGAIKIILATSLLLKKLFAFPLAVAFLIILLLYQIIQMFYTPSLYLGLFNLFDSAVILVIWLEYQHLKKTKGFH